MTAADGLIAHLRLRLFLAALIATLVASACRVGSPSILGPAENIAPGVRLYEISGATLPELPGPIAIQVLRLDPGRVSLRSALAQDEVMGTETVADIAARHKAIAAINAGFFLPNGDPAGVLQIERELVSDSGRPRGAVAITRKDGRTRLTFDVITIRARIRLTTPEGPSTVDLAGVDTTRQRGKLMLFTPRYHPHTDTAARGIEWIADGAPLMVRERREDAGSSPIPRTGVVLSYGGLDPPAPLSRLAVGDRLAIEYDVATRHGTAPAHWTEADDVIGGAGLLIREGRPVDSWADEDIRSGFDTERHPRTMIGRDHAGQIWLVTVDGRNPALSVGMSFAELQRLASRLQLVDALNLDGGGSTTMVVGGRVVNHPSDAAGPRKVSDAILVVDR